MSGEDYLIVWLPKSLWDGVVSGDSESTRKASDMLDGQLIYDHAFSAPSEWGDVVGVRIYELENFGVIKAVTLHREIQ